tara:strand:+ start:73 stop:324 length:252 start_codon:yes stop_codon:yes gene_type:complete
MAYKMKYKGYIGKGKSPMKLGFLGQAARENELNKQYEDKIKNKEKELQIDKLDAEMSDIHIEQAGKQRDAVNKQKEDYIRYGS